jgi:hypothetical protein
MRSAAVKWSVGSTAFFLPGLVGMIVDSLGRSQATNGLRVDAPSLLVITVLLAAGVCAGIIMTAPISPGRRFALVVGVWCVLCLEAGCIITWWLRGLQ